MQEMKQSQEATQQLATLTAIKDAFALQIEVQKKENETLVSQLDHLQREYAFSTLLRSRVETNFNRCSGSSFLLQWL